MSDSVADALATPLSNLRTLWLDAECCAGPNHSPIWYCAARWPGWLLSDLAMNHSCPPAVKMQALARVVPGERGPLQPELPLRASARARRPAYPARPGHPRAPYAAR